MLLPFLISSIASVFDHVVADLLIEFVHAGFLLGGVVFGFADLLFRGFVLFDSSSLPDRGRI